MMDAHMDGYFLIGDLYDLETDRAGQFIIRENTKCRAWSGW